MATFVTSFQDRYPNVKPAVLLALKEGKEYQKVLPLLASFAARIYLTTFKTSQDLPARSIDPSIMAAELHRCSEELLVECIPDQHIALQALMDAPDKIVVITGSFYLLSQLRKNERIID